MRDRDVQGSRRDSNFIRCGSAKPVQDSCGRRYQGTACAASLPPANEAIVARLVWAKALRDGAAASAKPFQPTKSLKSSLVHKYELAHLNMVFPEDTHDIFGIGRFKDLWGYELGARGDLQFAAQSPLDVRCQGF